MTLSCSVRVYFRLLLSTELRNYVTFVALYRPSSASSLDVATCHPTSPRLHGAALLRLRSLVEPIAAGEAFFSGWLVLEWCLRVDFGALPEPSGWTVTRRRRSKVWSPFARSRLVCKSSKVVMQLFFSALDVLNNAEFVIDQIYFPFTGHVNSLNKGFTWPVKLSKRYELALNVSVTLPRRAGA
ncbi:hypothetical protein EVAR_73844_1 [Eumeta japonica]|uniref:Uncharacterized protein n=1 Tax=Eumeta variegata TaxID=151549 RepID=A0A4C1SJ53_EUMVA|nr:hypothetical protein EVAR_73844_1 [Eumeta japonica]